MPFLHDRDENELRVDKNLLNALLNLSEYNYGVRSIEAIVDMSVAVHRRARQFTRTMLPPPEQLAMHVNVEEFLTLTWP